MTVVLTRTLYEIIPGEKKIKSRRLTMRLKKIINAFKYKMRFYKNPNTLGTLTMT